MSILWIRKEYKEDEHRAPIVPKHAKYLIQNGHLVMIESCSSRIFSDVEYQSAGCTVVDPGSWINAPSQAYILGIKKIPNDTSPLIHRHIYFAHAYNHKRIFNEKDDSLNLIHRFIKGDGKHYDLEFLVDNEGKRTCAFGYYAGVVGVYITLALWYEKHLEKKSIFNYIHLQNKQDIFFQKIERYKKFITPKILVIGANGRCGSGVVDILKKHNINYTAFGRHETSVSNIDQKIMSFDILINCINASESTHQLINSDSLNKNRKLSVIGDIGCETSANNPIKIYCGTTNYNNLSHKVMSASGLLDIIAIDNLPSFFSRNSSIYFSSQLVKELCPLLNGENTISWKNAEQIFNKIKSSIK